MKHQEKRTTKLCNKHCGKKMGKHKRWLNKISNIYAFVIFIWFPYNFDI